MHKLYTGKSTFKNILQIITYINFQKDFRDFYVKKYNLNHKYTYNSGHKWNFNSEIQSLTLKSVQNNL